MNEEPIFMGRRMEQYSQVPELFEELFTKFAPLTVLEAGTGTGALTAWYASLMKSGKVLTLDPVSRGTDFLNEPLLFPNIKVNFVKTTLEIYLKEAKKFFLKGLQPRLLLIDTRTKRRQYELVIDWQEVGDIIMSHDFLYPENGGMLQEEIDNILIGKNFVPYMKEDFWPVGWSCHQKIEKQ